MKQLDLGCSGILRTQEGYDCTGIDIVPHPENPNILQLDLIWEPLPFDNDSFELVTACDFLEHLPHVIYNGKERRQVTIELFNEIYRVLKHEGIFYSETPIYPDKSVFQDPTHLSFWTDDSMNYFSGDYFGWHDHYGHTSRFEQIEKRNENSHLFSRLKAIKNLPKEVEYKLKYI